MIWQRPGQGVWVACVLSPRSPFIDRARLLWSDDKAAAMFSDHVWRLR